MGLAGTKRRNKIGNDPNNTNWSKSTDGFGHKILSAQGWKPGQTLGAENASHAEHLTAASTSHIRVALREDNLGLGAQVGTSNADTFGLSTLSGIFGRLNGKTDADVQKSQAAQRDVELRSYQTRKHGTMNFIRGGVLLGDKMEDLIADNNTPVQPALMKTERKTKVAMEEAEATTESDTPDAKQLKALLKAEKRERKEAKRKRKADQLEVTQSTAASSASVTPSVPSTPTFSGSRHNVRQRFIQQKRLASMDARALDEILMRKAPVC